MHSVQPECLRPKRRLERSVWWPAALLSSSKGLWGSIRIYGHGGLYGSRTTCWLVYQWLPVACGFQPDPEEAAVSHCG